MKRRRGRAWARWTLTSLAIASVAALTVSWTGLWHWGQLNPWMAWLSRGTLELTHCRPDVVGELALRTIVGELRESTLRSRSATVIPRGFFGQHVHAIGLPLWIPSAALIAFALRSWRRADRHPGRCRQCDYHLSGLSADTPCPECGRAPTPLP